MRHIIGYHEPSEGTFLYISDPVPMLRASLSFLDKTITRTIPVFNAPASDNEIRLPTDKFQVIKEGKTCYIKGGIDTSPNCLFSAGIEVIKDPFPFVARRDIFTTFGVELVTGENGTTSQVLAQLQGEDIGVARISVLTLMKPGEQLVLKKWSPQITYKWKWSGETMKLTISSSRKES